MDDFYCSIKISGQEQIEQIYFLPLIEQDMFICGSWDVTLPLGFQLFKEKSFKQSGKIDIYSVLL